MISYLRGGEVQAAEGGGNRPRKAEIYNAGYKAALVHGAVVVSSVLIVSAYFFNSFYKEGVEKGYKEGFQAGLVQGYREGYGDGSKIGQGSPIILSSSSEDNVKLGSMAILAVTVISLTLISKCFGLCGRGQAEPRRVVIQRDLSLALMNALLLGNQTNR